MPRVSKEVKVVLAGQGTNEVFGGYFCYPLMDAETGPALERCLQVDGVDQTPQAAR